MIYDKTYKLQERNLIVEYENLPEGVLRFEVHCGRAYIQKICNKSGKPSTTELLWQMTKRSESLLIGHFSRCFPDTEFAQIEELEQKINASSIKSENTELMLKLCDKLRRVQSVDAAINQMKKGESDTSGLLDRFEKLGVSPIPLRVKFCAKKLPGPVNLLRSISEGKCEVEYIKVKHK